MNRVLKTAAALSSVLVLASHADAASTEPTQSATSSASGVVGRVENAIVRAAQAAASGVERGVKAAASGVERGAKATARGVEHGAKATASAASRVASKVAGSPASSPATGK